MNAALNEFKEEDGDTSLSTMKSDGVSGGSHGREDGTVPADYEPDNRTSPEVNNEN